jgi:hypothetical protein
MMTVDGLRKWIADIPPDHMIFGVIVAPVKELFARYDELLSDQGEFAAKCCRCGWEKIGPKADAAAIEQELNEHIGVCPKSEVTQLKADLEAARKLLGDWHV